jgi:cyanophycinase
MSTSASEFRKGSWFAACAVGALSAVVTLCAEATLGQEDPATRRAMPAGVVVYRVGDPADARVAPRGPALALMGGGPEVDEAFEWWRERAAGGDVVVLRASGSDGYQAYLHEDIGGFRSVETLVITGRAAADSAAVAARVDRAEAVWLAGGDQGRYVELWAGTRLERALQEAWERGAVLGGTSAGCMVLGEVCFAARAGSARSGSSLADPFGRRVDLAPGLLRAPPTAGVVLDTHFGQRDRLGRLVVFLARAWVDAPDSPAGLLGLGLDERTALIVDEGPAGWTGTVLGAGQVSAVRARARPEVCQPGEALEWQGLELRTLVHGDQLSLPGGGEGPGWRPLRATPEGLEVGQD